MIYFSKPSITKKEFKNVNKVLKSGILTDGFFQQNAELLIKKKINSKFIYLTQSCTDALEVAAELIKLKPGDEVIMPSYTFTSTANSVVLGVLSQFLLISMKMIFKLMIKKLKA